MDRDLLRQIIIDEMGDSELTEVRKKVEGITSDRVC
jgi:hypothetical protein